MVSVGFTPAMDGVGTMRQSGCGVTNPPGLVSDSSSRGHAAGADAAVWASGISVGDFDDYGQSSSAAESDFGCD